MKALIIGGCLIAQAGCAHNAYEPQSINIPSHTLILHKTKVQMENAYLRATVDQKAQKDRGEYGGFFDPKVNELHCYGPWPEGCILHEYKHLGTKYGLKVPDDPHFRSRIIIIKRRRL